ncbi:MAG: hypothetical protein K6E54_09955 [Bacteroidaceae bacterium]|nr:hypothetical protein [Bacteroidaceae bacterium]
MKIYRCVLLLISVLPIRCFSQNSVSSLCDLGFENVKVMCVSDTVFASVEDPTYRGTFRGAAVALQSLAKSYPDMSNFELVFEENQIDVLAVHGNVEDGKWNVDVDYDTKEIAVYTDRVSEDSVANKSVGKIDVTLYPMVSLINTLTYKLFRYSVSFAPAIETSLWKGNHIILQPIIPLVNNYEPELEDSENRYFQIGSTNIQQDLIDNGKMWAKISAGFFHYNYLGCNAVVGAHLNRYFDISAFSSVVRLQDLNTGLLRVRDENYYSALVKLSYFEPYFSVGVDVTAGRFLFGDYGVRLDATCRFGEYCIGGYGILTGGEHNAGFHFSIPFAGKKQKRNKYLSVRLPESFDWEYSMEANYGWAEKRCGETVEIKGGRNRAQHYWQARYIELYLQKCLNGDVD